MQKILVTGNAGSGKTTTSRKIGALLGANVYGLDKIVWKSGWQKTPLEEKQEAINRITTGPRWVIDGVSHQLFDAADTVVFLDIPLHKCIANIILRSFGNGLKTRPDLPPDCPEYLGLFKAIKIAFQYQKRTRPEIIERISQQGYNKRIIHARSYTRLNDEIRKLESTDLGLS